MRLARARVSPPVCGSFSGWRSQPEAHSAEGPWQSPTWSPPVGRRTRRTVSGPKPLEDMQRPMFSWASRSAPCAAQQSNEHGTRQEAVDAVRSDRASQCRLRSLTSQRTTLRAKRRARGPVARRAGRSGRDRRLVVHRRRARHRDRDRRVRTCCRGRDSGRARRAAGRRVQTRRGSARAPRMAPFCRGRRRRDRTRRTVGRDRGRVHRGREQPVRRDPCRRRRRRPHALPTRAVSTPNPYRTFAPR